MGDAEFLNRAFEEEYVEEEDYSPSDIAKINRAAEEARQGINVSGPFEGDEAIHYLRSNIYPCRFDQREKSRLDL